MLLSIIIEPGPAATAIPELELFRSVTNARCPKFRALLGSLASHFVVLALIAALSLHPSWFRQDDLDWSRYRVEPLRLHLVQPIFFDAKASDNPPAVAAHPDKAGEAAVSPVVRSAAPDRLQLPPVRSSVKDAPIILQPDFQNQTTPLSAALPTLAFWARQAPDLPKPRPREVVVPGRTEGPSPAPKPGGPPVLAVPNREAAAADINIAMPQTQTQAPPALPVPNTATMPVSLPGLTEPRTASFETFSGQPVNVIAMAAGPSDTRNVEVPRGLQNIPASASGDGGAPGTGRSDARKVEAPRELQKTPASAADGAAPGAGRNRSPGQVAGGSPQSAARPSGSSVPAQPPSAPAREASAPKVIRIQHPSNGSFDVVIMQSVARDELSGLAGMLTGSPVYTVYLSVGDQKEWLMEYCVPARANMQANAYQIYVDDAGSVTPPYPIFTSIPDSIRAQRTAKQIVLPGLLTAAGNLQLAKTPDLGTPSMYELVTLVNQWRFRPALRNNKAIDVEVLLVIPPLG